MNRFLTQKEAITAAMFSLPPSLPAAAAHFAASCAGMEAYRLSMQSVRSWANQTLEAEATKTLFGSFATFLIRYGFDLKSCPASTRRRIPDKVKSNIPTKNVPGSHVAPHQ